MDLKQEISEQVAKASPPIAVLAAASASSWTLGDTLTVITIIYVLLQLIFLIWKWKKAAKNSDLFEKKSREA